MPLQTMSRDNEMCKSNYWKLHNWAELKCLKTDLGCGLGQVVSVLALYSDEPSSNHAEVNSIFWKICAWGGRK